MSRIHIDDEGWLVREQNLPEEMSFLDMIASHEPAISEEESYKKPKHKQPQSLRLPGTYFIADIHPKYPPCTEEITKRVLMNWAQKIHNDDTVYVLGNQGPNGRNGIDSILSQYKGIVQFVPDEDSLFYPLSADFLLVHDLEDVPDDWHGWTIHGCPGQKICKTHPFINGEMRTINVSASLVGYSPVNFDFLLSLDLDTIMRIETSKSKPQRYQ